MQTLGGEESRGGRILQSHLFPARKNQSPHSSTVLEKNGNTNNVIFEIFQ